MQLNQKIISDSFFLSSLGADFAWNQIPTCMMCSAAGAATSEWHLHRPSNYVFAEQIHLKVSWPPDKVWS